MKHGLAKAVNAVGVLIAFLGMPLRDQLQPVGEDVGVDQAEPAFANLAWIYFVLKPGAKLVHPMNSRKDRAAEWTAYLWQSAAKPTSSACTSSISRT